MKRYLFLLACLLTIPTISKAQGQFGGGGGSGSGLPAGGLVGQTVINTAAGVGTWQGPGIADGNAGAAVTTTPYTVLCDNGATLRDRLTIIRLQSGAGVVNLPDHTAAGCGGNFSIAFVDDGAGTVTFNRGGADTISTFTGSANADGAASFTITNGQYVSLTNGASTVWEARITTGGGSSVAIALTTVPTLIQNGTAAQPAQNTTLIWGVYFNQSITTNTVTYMVNTADNTANLYDLGLYNSSGTLVAHLGATAGTTFASSATVFSLNWTGGPFTLSAGKYYVALTTNCSTTCAKLFSGPTQFTFASAVSPTGGGTSGGALNASITAPADAFSGAGGIPSLVIR